MTGAGLPITLGTVGLVVGSFLGLVSIRLPAGRDIVAGRSRCGSCGETLSPLQLVPVASYVLSRGRCSNCGAHIPLRYPLIELAAAALGILAASFISPALTAGLVALVGWQLLLMVVIFAEHRRAPPYLTASLLITAAVAVALLAFGQRQ